MKDNSLFQISNWPFPSRKPDDIAFFESLTCRSILITQYFINIYAPRLKRTVNSTEAGRSGQLYCQSVIPLTL